MLSHTIVFAVLSILSMVAIHAVRRPVEKSSAEQQVTPEIDATRDAQPGIPSAS